MNGPRRRSWPEEVARTGFQMMVLPWRLLGLGLQVMTRAVDGAQRAVDGGGVAPPEPWGVSPGNVFSTAGPAAPAGPADEDFAGSAAVSGVIAERGETFGQEEKDMSCCDQDMSGCDLKVAQYTIVSTDPYISDDRRIILGPETVATSDDMTDADFTAYVIAKNLERHRDRFRGYKTQYLRVCYTVICRLTMPCTDYDKEQVDALRAINRTLREKGLLGEEGLSRREEREERREEHLEERKENRGEER